MQVRIYSTKKYLPNAEEKFAVELVNDWKNKTIAYYKHLINAIVFAKDLAYVLECEIENEIESN